MKRALFFLSIIGLCFVVIAQAQTIGRPWDGGGNAGGSSECVQGIPYPIEHLLGFPQPVDHNGVPWERDRWNIDVPAGSNAGGGPVINDFGMVANNCGRPWDSGYLYASDGILVEPPETMEDLIVFSSFIQQVGAVYNISIKQTNLNPTGLNAVRIESHRWGENLPCQVDEILQDYRSAGYTANHIRKYPVYQIEPGEISRDLFGSDSGLNWIMDPYLIGQLPYPHGIDDYNGFPDNEGGYVRSRYAMWPPDGEAPNAPSEVLLVISDTGLHWRYNDFIANLWQNLGEDANGNGYVIRETESGWEFDWQDINYWDDDANGPPDDLIGYNFVDHTPDPTHSEYEFYSHGTSVYGVAAEETYDGRHMAGTLFPGYVKVVPTKVGLGLMIDEAAAIEGIYYAAVLIAHDNKVVLNMSWGGEIYSEPLQQALETFTNFGGFAVAAVGNSNDSRVRYPAGYSDVLSVAASTDQNVRASWSNFGAWCDVIAPGEKILAPFYFTTSPFDGMHYWFLDGTSFSSPIVAAMAAMYWSIHPEIDNARLKTKIIESIYTPGDYPWDPPGTWCDEVFWVPPHEPECGSPFYGEGIVDAVILFEGQ